MSTSANAPETITISVTNENAEPVDSTKEEENLTPRRIKSISELYYQRSSTENKNAQAAPAPTHEVKL